MQPSDVLHRARDYSIMQKASSFFGLRHKYCYLTAEAPGWAGRYATGTLLIAHFGQCPRFYPIFCSRSPLYTVDRIDRLRVDPT